jgi:hypothetical protein
MQPFCGRGYLQRWLKLFVLCAKKWPSDSLEALILSRSQNSFKEKTQTVRINFKSRWDNYLILIILIVLDEFDYGFAENGVIAYKLGKALPSKSFIAFLGEDKYKPLVNFILHYIADLDIPIKR